MQFFLAIFRLPIKVEEEAHKAIVIRFDMPTEYENIKFNPQKDEKTVNNYDYHSSNAGKGKTFVKTRKLKIQM